MQKDKTIFIGGDHTSYEVREKLQKFLMDLDFLVFNEGSNTKESTSYATYGLKVAKKVQQNEDSRGIVISGSGIGINIAANKVKGVKSTLVFSNKSALYANKHNSNVIALGARFLTFNQIIEYVKIFLDIDKKIKPKFEDFN